MNEELREVVIRIGDGAVWGNNTGYQPFNNGYNYTACDAYTIMCTDIVNGKDVNGYGEDTVANRKDITVNTIQPYDIIVLPSNVQGKLHAAFVLYVDPTTGALLTTEGNYNGTTRTGWNIWSWDKVIAVERRATSAWWDDDIWF